MSLVNCHATEDSIVTAQLTRYLRKIELVPPGLRQTVYTMVPWSGTSFKSRKSCGKSCGEDVDSLIIFFDPKTVETIRSNTNLCDSCIISFAIAHELAHLVEGQFVIPMPGDSINIGFELEADRYACSILCSLHMGRKDCVNAITMLAGGINLSGDHPFISARIKYVNDFFDSVDRNTQGIGILTISHDSLYRMKLGKGHKRGENFPLLDLDDLINLYNRGENPRATGIREIARKSSLGQKKIIDVGWTLLHECAAHNDLEHAKELVDKGVDINAVNKNHASPLIIAAHYGSKEVYNYLLGLPGIDTTIRTILTKREASKMTHDLEYFGTPISQINPYKFSKINLRTPDQELRSLLSVNSIRQDSLIVLKIAKSLARNANPETVGEDGSTILTAACYWDKIDAILSKDIALKIKDRAVITTGEKPLMFAIEGNSPKAVSYLYNMLHVALVDTDLDGNVALCYKNSTSDTAYKLLKRLFEAEQLRKLNKKNYSSTCRGISKKAAGLNKNLLSRMPLDLQSAYWIDSNMLYKFNMNNVNKVYYENNKSILLYPLLYAVVRGDTNAVDSLILHGAKPRLIDGIFSLFDLADDNRMKDKLAKHGIRSALCNIKCNAHK